MAMEPPAPTNQPHPPACLGCIMKEFKALGAQVKNDLQLLETWKGNMMDHQDKMNKEDALINLYTPDLHELLALSLSP